MVEPMIANLAGPQITTRWLGTLSYEEGASVQAQAEKEIALDGSSKILLLGLEHRSVITLGKRGDVKTDTRTSAETLKAKGIELAQSERGGQATLHSPGQLVIYPIVPLKRLGIGVREYVALLEDVSLGWLAKFNIEASRGKLEPGIYTAKGKTIFFGIRVRNGISSHGLAINACNDLSLFDLIRSCGVQNETFARLKDFGVDLFPSELFLSWAEEFEQGLARILPRSLDSRPPARLD